MKNKLKVYCICITIFCAVLQANAQDAPIKVSYKINNDRSVDFRYEKKDPGAYALILKLNNLNNSSNSPLQSYDVSGYSGSFLTLNPINKEQNITFSYSYSYIRGKLKPKYNADFVYVLPYKVGTKIRAAESGFANSQYFGSTTPEDWKSYRFYTKTEDTVSAARKGTVVEVKDLYDTEIGASFTSKTNEVMIEHLDGTIAYYRGFKKGSIAVKVGDIVFPGTTLGLNGRLSTDQPFNISLLISYLKSTDVESTRGQSMQNYKSLYGFVTPHFFTAANANSILVSQQEYIVVATPEIIQKEFTKKELKNLTNKQ